MATLGKQRLIVLGGFRSDIGHLLPEALTSSRRAGDRQRRRMTSQLGTTATSNDEHGKRDDHDHQRADRPSVPIPALHHRRLPTAARTVDKQVHVSWHTDHGNFENAAAATSPRVRAHPWLWSDPFTDRTNRPASQ